jgi:outer membrane protein
MKILKNTILAILLLGFTYNSNAQQKLLTLEDAMEIALENSPDIQKSKLYMEKNRELLNAQYAALKSNFSLEVTPIQYSRREVYESFNAQWYTEENKSAFTSLIVSQPVRQTDGTLILRNDLAYQDQYSETQFGTTTTTGFNNNLFIEYNQPLFTYNRTKMNLERNKLSLENATISYSLQMLNLEMQVTQAFYYIYQKQRTLKIAQEEYDNQKISKDIIESKVAAGLSAKEELVQAELNLATSKSNLDNKKVDLENERDQFKLLLGLPINDSVEVDANVEFKPVVIDLNKAIENGISQRMEIRQRKIDITYAEFELVQNSATNEFRADMRLSLGLMGNNEQFMNIYENPTRSPQIGIKFIIPLFDWGERKAMIKAAEVEIETKEIELEVQENNIVLNIRKIFRNLENLINQIVIAEKNEKNAQLTYEINLERYKTVI